MGRVKITILYDDAQEDETAQWSAFGIFSEDRGPMLSIERWEEGTSGWHAPDARRKIDFTLNGMVNTPNELVALVLGKAAAILADEHDRADCPHEEIVPISWLNAEGVLGLMFCCAKCGAEVKFVALSEGHGVTP